MDFRHNYVAFFTIVRKEVVRWLRIWPQTLFPSVITQTLYFTIFGKLIGSQLRDINGVSYMSFIVPGLVMMAVITNSYNNVVSSFFGSKFQRNVEELLVSPTPNWIIISGYVIGGILRGFVVGILVFLVSTFFTRPVISHYGWIFVFIFLTAVLFALGGFFNAMIAKKFDDITIFPTFILTPLIYLGGVFYSIHDLPVFWQNFSKVNPILYMVNGFRYGFYGFSDVGVSASVLIILSFIFSLIALNMFMMKKGIGLKT